MANYFFLRKNNAKFAYFSIIHHIFYCMAISKAWQKLIRSLHQKKYRKEQGLFFVEGEKVVLELLQSDYEVEILFGTKDFFLQNKITSSVKCEMALETDLVALGTFQSNKACLAVVKQKKMSLPNLVTNELILVLDNIQDPGNLGTIIRICDWYGIKNVVCSNETVDFYNPKVINSSKASFLRVNCIYTNLTDFLKEASVKNIQVYGAVLNGSNIYSTTLQKNGIVVIGNEANGISSDILYYVNQKISIPCFGNAESLNVGVATAVVIDNFFRQNYQHSFKINI